MLRYGRMHEKKRVKERIAFLSELTAMVDLRDAKYRQIEHADELVEVEAKRIQQLKKDYRKAQIDRRLQHHRHILAVSVETLAGSTATTEVASEEHLDALYEITEKINDIVDEIDKSQSNITDSISKKQQAEKDLQDIVVKERMIRHKIEVTKPIKKLIHDKNDKPFFPGD